jgi:hypothetical protein
VTASAAADAVAEPVAAPTAALFTTALTFPFDAAVAVAVEGEVAALVVAGADEALEAGVAACRTFSWRWSTVPFSGSAMECTLVASTNVRAVKTLIT